AQARRCADPALVCEARAPTWDERRDSRGTRAGLHRMTPPNPCLGTESRIATHLHVPRTPLHGAAPHTRPPGPGAPLPAARGGVSLAEPEPGSLACLPRIQVWPPNHALRRTFMFRDLPCLAPHPTPGPPAPEPPSPPRGAGATPALPPLPPLPPAPIDPRTG